MSNKIVYRTLYDLLQESLDHFMNNDSQTSATLRQYLRRIEENLTHIEPIAKDFIGNCASNYDVVPGVQANGYRSLLALLEALLLQIIGLLRTMHSDRTNTFFRGNSYIDKLSVYSDVLHQMRAIMYYAQILIGLTPNGNLFVNEDHSEPLMHDCELMAKSCFYSSVHGFQYSSGFHPVVQSLSMIVASYNDVHKHKASAWKTLKSALNSGRYVLSPELRGEKLEQLYNSADVEFFKNFWSLPEQGLIKAIPNFVGESVQVNREFKIPPSSFTLPDARDPNKDIPISRISPLGPAKPVKARLISAVYREGQDSSESPSSPDTGFDKSKVGFKRAKAHPRSKNLIFFCHGGGFIALTSKSYEMILRQWSKSLDCPIFSVDYSLAPEAPFPEAFEECFFAYAWALNNAELLGTTAENIVFAGDSAGGNLVLSVAMRAAQYGIRVPNTVVAMYPACIVRYSASPARLMSVMDPLLPLGILSGCLGAYSGVKIEKIKRSESSQCPLSTPERPMSPSSKPVNVSLLSNFVKDVGAGFAKIANSASSSNVEKTWWDDEFEIINIEGKTSPKSGEQPNLIDLDSEVEMLTMNNNSDTPNGPELTSSAPCSSAQSPSLDFHLKLPQNFQPLKSKFAGDSFKMHRSPLVKNAYISPALAPDELLKGLPYTDIVGCEFDPLFDDSIMLAKRLQNIGHDYQLHVFKGLPHGFLNFQLCKEAKTAATECLELIRKGLERR
ncbi:hormone-sensitive lipase [Ciona intestinalis]